MEFFEILENLIILFGLLNPLLFGSFAAFFAKIFFEFLLWIYQFYRCICFVIFIFLEKIADFGEFYITENVFKELKFSRLFGGGASSKNNVSKRAFVKLYYKQYNIAAIL